MSPRSRLTHLSNAEIIFEQLEERIVLDGAVDDVWSRADLLSAQAVDNNSVTDSHILDAVLTDTLMGAESLALETGTEWLQDSTWHYWEQDWDASGNGYRFDVWQDVSSSFHQIQWDAALNSKGTHNGFDYNLQRDGSWTYQAVQWDAGQNGYSYDENSTGFYHYQAHQWANGLGYDYTSDSTAKWTYHVVSAGTAAGDKIDYASDSTNYWNYTYTWANGVTWNDSSANHPFMVEPLINQPANLTNVNGTLYFSYYDLAYGFELCRSDGTGPGTIMIKDINPGSNGSAPENLTDVNGALYFTASDGVNGNELWKSDGTEHGTVMVEDINPGNNASNPSYLTKMNGTLYFLAGDGTHGTELWKSQGTDSGTILVTDISPGNLGSTLLLLTNVNGTLYFYVTNHDLYEYELWAVRVVSGLPT